jgi:hypothetical protein
MTMKRFAELPRPLTAIETRLIQWGLSEREAVALAPRMELSADATDAQITLAVTCAMVEAKEAATGRAEVLYLGGIRRDTLRGRP